MAKAKNNLSNRDRMAMKELAKKNLYGEETEGSIVDFEKVEREIISRAQSHIEGMGGVRRIMSPPKKDKPKSPGKKKRKKKGNGKEEKVRSICKERFRAFSLTSNSQLVAEERQERQECQECQECQGWQES